MLHLSALDPFDRTRAIAKSARFMRHRHVHHISALAAVFGGGTVGYCDSGRDTRSVIVLLKRSCKARIRALMQDRGKYLFQILPFNLLCLREGCFLRMDGWHITTLVFGAVYGWFVLQVAVP
jgi:hypothetical protein